MRTCAPFGQARAGEVRQAYELLALIYGWFTEGFDTLPLRGLDTLPSERGSTGHFRVWHEADLARCPLFVGLSG